MPKLSPKLWRQSRALKIQVPKSKALKSKALKSKALKSKALKSKALKSNQGEIIRLLMRNGVCE